MESENIVIFFIISHAALFGMAAYFFMENRRLKNELGASRKIIPFDPCRNKKTPKRKPIAISEEELARREYKEPPKDPA